MAVPPKDGNGNGSVSITPKTRIPLSMAAGAVLSCLTASGAYWSLLERVHHLEDRVEDRFTGTDADRFAGRIQWAWQDLAERLDLDSYPVVPPWREGTKYVPSVIHRKPPGDKE